MKLPKLKKWQWITIAVLLLFIFTNPSLNSFKQYCGLETKDEYPSIRKNANFFLFSVYNESGASYVGVLSNFIRVPERTEPKVSNDAYIEDLKKKEEASIPKQAVTAMPMTKEDSLDAEIKSVEDNITRLYRMESQKADINEKAERLKKLKQKEKDILSGKNTAYQKGKMKIPEQQSVSSFLLSE